MKKLILTAASIVILFLLALAGKPAFSQVYAHSGDSEINQINLENKFQQRFGKKISTTRLQKPERPLNSVAPISEPFTLYGNGPSGSEDFYVTFNLESKQMVRYELVNLEGKSLIRNEWPDVSNQTFRIEHETVSSGLYIFRMIIGDKYYMNRVYISQ